MALREVLAKFGFDIDQSKLEAGIKATDSFADRVTKLANQFAGGSFSDAIKGWIGDVGDAASEFKGLAKLTGVSAEEMQRWTTAAKLSGSSVEALTQGIRVLMRNQAQAASDGKSGFEEAGEGALEAVLSGKAAQEMFKSLGVSVKDSNGEMKSATQLLGDVGLEIAKVKNPAERAALATKLLGRQGASLLPLFSEGEEGLRKYLDKLDELGGGVSQETLAALSANKKASKEFDVAILGVKSAIVGAVLPALTAKVKLLTSLFAWINRVTKNTEVFRAGVLVLSGAFLVLQRQAIASAIRTAIAWAPTLALFALLVLLVDDVLTAFKGGDSVIGRFLDSLLGVGAGKAIFGQMSKDATDLGNRLNTLPGIGAKVEEVFSTIGASIVRFFVDDIPEAAGFLWPAIKAKWAEFDAGATAFFRSIVVSIVHAFQDMVLAGKTMAKDLVDGIVDGLKNGWIKVSDSIKELGKSLIEDFKKVFESHSPSRVFYRETGYLPEGSILALEAWAPKVRAAAESLFGEMNVFPGSQDFAPTVRVQAVTPTGALNGTRTVEMRNQVTNQFYGVGSNVRDTVMGAMSDGFDDQRSALMATLEPGG